MISDQFSADTDSDVVCVVVVIGDPFLSLCSHVFSQLSLMQRGIMGAAVFELSADVDAGGFR